MLYTVQVKLLLRSDRCLSCVQISGTFTVDNSGNVEFVEEDGIDYAAVTVQLPGGERVPFLFTVKELVVRPSVQDISDHSNRTSADSLALDTLIQEPPIRFTGQTTNINQIRCRLGSKYCACIHH